MPLTATSLVNLAVPDKKSHSDQKKDEKPNKSGEVSKIKDTSPAGATIKVTDKQSEVAKIK